MSQEPIVLGVTGASGAAYWVRLLEILLADGRSVHAVFSPAAVQVCREELGYDLTPQSLTAEGVAAIRFPWSAGPRGVDTSPGTLVTHRHVDWTAGPASGSFRTAAMVVCPCSMGTLAEVAAGLCSNLISRAAAVHLKERRPLVLVPRETPLSPIHLRNMVELSNAGAVLLPAMPGFYHGVSGVDDLVDFVVGRVCDQLGVDKDLVTPWGAD